MQKHEKAKRKNDLPVCVAEVVIKVLKAPKSLKDATQYKADCMTHRKQ